MPRTFTLTLTQATLSRSKDSSMRLIRPTRSRSSLRETSCALEHRFDHVGNTKCLVRFVGERHACVFNSAIVEIARHRGITRRMGSGSNRINDLAIRSAGKKALPRVSGQRSSMKLKHGKPPQEKLGQYLPQGPWNDEEIVVERLHPSGSGRRLDD
jgi:hypothetical protein